eukprot:TRINITY_DN2564_c0_g1_i1.p2 TRINITY_DN2564_c0_g1~~TRINITY_DN2564_c0_g1_i1.p2  ORF type:complete len:113 (+),score=0.78 TRINITY_DN2564_c0_g1_i1:1062-1400(+)
MTCACCTAGPVLVVPSITTAAPDCLMLCTASPKCVSVVATYLKTFMWINCQIPYLPFDCRCPVLEAQPRTAVLQHGSGHHYNKVLRVLLTGSIKGNFCCPLLFKRTLTVANE